MSIQLYSSPMKYKDPNTGNYTNIIGISGNPGRGIASVELNNDYTLTLTFTDGTSTTTSSIRGNGIESIEKTSTSGLIDTYTITDSDSNTYTFEVTNGDVPNLTIGTVTEGEEASATITGSREDPVLNLVLPLPSLTNYVKKTDYANGTNTGVIRVNNNYGLTNVDASDGGVGRTTYTAIMAPTTTEIRTGADRYKPIVPRNQHEASFYGLAKAAGDTSQAQSSNAVGTYTASAKAAIQAMLDVPSNAAMQQAIDNINTMKIHICTSGEYDAETGVPTVQNPDAQTFYLVPGGESSNLFIEWVYVDNAWERFGSADVEVPVNDVQVNSVSVVDANGVANVPLAGTTRYGVVRVGGNYGLKLWSENDSLIVLIGATSSQIKAGDWNYQPIVTSRQHESIYYGLAKAAGADMANITGETVGTYPDEQKSAIQNMLGVSDLLAPRETSYIASQAYAVGDIFTLNGKLYKVTTAIAESGAIVVQDDGETVSGANAVQCKLGEETIKDVQINGTSLLQDGVANVPIANLNDLGVCKFNKSYGLNIYDNGIVRIWGASSDMIKNGTNESNAVTCNRLHESAFYGLAKAAGDTTQASSANAVGTYTDEAKAAIKSMIGVNVDDVQINGTSIVLNNVANIPKMTTTVVGVEKLANGGGLKIVANGIATDVATDAQIKTGLDNYRPIVPSNQQTSVFYGLAKAAGDTTQSQSDNAVGTYTTSAKNAIHTMLGTADLIEVGFVENVTGTTPSITGQANYRYVCGEVSTISITPPSAGSIDVIFESGSTASVLTVPNTVKWPTWFDPTDLEANTTYELLITDATYGSVMTWAT